VQTHPSFDLTGLPQPTWETISGTQYRFLLDSMSKMHLPVLFCLLSSLLPPWPEWHHFSHGFQWWLPDGPPWSTLAPPVQSQASSPFRHSMKFGVTAKDPTWSAPSTSLSHLLWPHFLALTRHTCSLCLERSTSGYPQGPLLHFLQATPKPYSSYSLSWPSYLNV
jgi:hypothetical protein